MMFPRPDSDKAGSNSSPGTVEERLDRLEHRARLDDRHHAESQSVMLELRAEIIWLRVFLAGLLAAMTLAGIGGLIFAMLAR